MNEIELYDILTLANGEEYTIIAKKNVDNKEYAMLVMVDKEENPIPENVKIVELQNGGSSVKDIDDEKLLELLSLELSKISVAELEKEDV